MLAAIATLIALAAAGPLTADLRAGGFDDPGSEAVAMRDRVEAATGVTPGAGVVALVTPGGDVRSRAGTRAIADVAAVLRADPSIARVTTPADPGGAAQVSFDGRRAYVVAYFLPGDDDFRLAGARRVEQALGDDPRVQVGGALVVAEQVTRAVTSDLTRAEAVALPIVFLLSLWVFRGVVAALLMPLMGAVAIFTSFFAIGVADSVTGMSVFSTNLVIALGLGLAVDYSLLVITRYREELARHGPGREALRVTLATAGRSIAFSAVTVGAALAGLMIFPVEFLFSMGLGGLMAALIAGATALVVLPAALALLGPRVNALAPARWQRRSRSAELEAGGFWYRLSRYVMARPGRLALLTAVVLLVVASPVLGIRFTAVDATVLPPGASARQVAETIDAEFPENLGDAILVAADADGDTEALAGYVVRLRSLPGMRRVEEPLPLGDGLWLVQAVPSAPVLSEDAQDLLRAVRGVPAGFPALAGGPTADFVDQRDAILDGLPWAVLVIAAVTVVALFVMTGSLVLPVKAVALNVLSLAATLGILVWIFQEGNLEGPLGFTSREGIGLTQPILLGAVAFGLSTDYAVFLLGRIKELRDGGLSNEEAVAVGLQRTGRVVTAAALLFAVAVGAFAFSGIILLKEIGVGNALAVLLDASIIRALLVPALMGLLGEWNWWAPAPLRRLHARIGLAEG